MSEELSEKVKLTVNGVLEDLQNGLTRDDIAEKYGLSKADIKAVFQHPKLKNKKTIKPKERNFILIDDTEEDSNEESQEPEQEGTSDEEQKKEDFGFTDEPKSKPSVEEDDAFSA